jgi:hypothetical protein
MSSQQAEREEHQRIIEEKQSRVFLKNTLDPLLSQLTKVSDADVKPRQIFGAKRERVTVAAADMPADKGTYGQLCAWVNSRREGSLLGGLL